ncbi:von Willebrand factor type A domain-containing protein [Mucilaginibacter sp. UR6-1]|uniref:YfbK domain-containing protein n=1 Tax=Mucilaginibacter sp. UR6-1 TaxID=1435643 RepID=UPI001E5634AE|nr:von Willebrand factor type A domain-containing protein [Mucilaginibacter sp. UR6-1]MCC8410327.1 von Willebrand factor type A domain-containing protein [Mucilaginibacter sp. UR6-1]
MKHILFIALMFAGLAGYSQANKTRTVSGTVSSRDGIIAEAKVVAEGTTISSTSNKQGRYNIKVPANTVRLLFSADGFESKKVAIGKSGVINVVLNRLKINIPVPVAVEKPREEKDKVQLNEVVAVQSPRIATQLQGKVAGLYVRGSRRAKINEIKAPVGYYANSAFDANTESYKGITENGFHVASNAPLSTFSVDVDAASYSNVRRFINGGQIPPVDAVRIEEMINYFNYNLSGPTNNDPVAIHTELTSAPWNTKHRLLRIGLKARTIPTENLPASNLVFLIDVSGSMSAENKLPLVKSSMKMLVNQLRVKDKVSIVVYAGAAGIVLQPTSGDKKTTINNAIDNLEAGGSTAGGEGIKLAYRVAHENLMKEGNNRVILATDGDFNVGASSDDDMEKLITKQREGGVFLSVLGYGMGNYKDSKMEPLADKGNGNYAYIDNITEARKTLVSEFGGTLFTVAKDVKLQLEFNPAKVQAYRLIGYENRLLNKEDFNNDKKDAGDMGSGHTVTALYEIVPVGVKDDYAGSVDPLKYQKPASAPKGMVNTGSGEMLTIKFRYKQPNSGKSALSQAVVNDVPVEFAKTSTDMKFASAVAEFGMLLRDSPYKQQASYAHAIKTARAGKGNDDEGYRAEFIKLAESARLLAKEEQLADSK